MRSSNPQSSTRTSHPLVRPLVRALDGYVPGEQLKIKGLIKLNTNENPYPPSSKVLEAVKDSVDGRLRLYPNPNAQLLREKLAELHGCGAENIVVGNGSDELLALATRAFVEPQRAPERGSLLTTTRRSTEFRHEQAELNSAATVQYFSPSYSLYPVLADIHGARKNSVPLDAQFGIPPLPFLHKSGKWDFNAALTLITTPNAPGGRGYSTASLEILCREQHGVVVLDEAYVDFAGENALRLALKYPHVIVSRTFSKAYSLCFQRVGYFIGHPDLIAALDKIRDSYNVNGLGQVAALATLDDLKYYRANFRKIIATRDQLSRDLTGLGFWVLPSQTNFILARPPRFPAKMWFEQLRVRKILVRWFPALDVRDFLRITIGTDAEADALLRASKALLKSK